MTDYTELVKALRDIEKTMFALGTSSIKMDNVSIRLAYDKKWGRTAKEAAAAIEELQAELEKKRAADCWGCKCEKVEPKRGEWVVFNKQMLINLENAREQYKELGYPHRTELGLQCSNCRKVTYVDSGIKYEFCPHCGAKMEVRG